MSPHPIAPRARRTARALLLTLSFSWLSGCAGCSGGPTIDDAGRRDGGGGGGGEPDAGSECRTVAIGEIGLDVQWDVETIYSAPLTTQIGSAVGDYLVFNFVNYNERIGPAAVGTFSLSEPPNDNRGPCAECLSVFQDQLTLDAVPAKVFFQSAGTIRLDTDPRSLVFKGRVEGLELVEVSINNFTLESEVVEGGECLRIEDFDIDFKHVPPEWTCDAELYRSGGECNCDCGAPDPDCWCDPFMNPDCPEVIEDDCGEGSICTYFGCRATCDMFSDPVVPCAPGELCSFDNAGQVCIAATGRVNGAALGETCTGESMYVQYCDVENTVPKGMCDDFDKVCRPVCRGLSSCEEPQSCYTIAVGAPENGGMGYCSDYEDGVGQVPEAPPGWECPAEQYGDGYICECNCGIPDVDCEDSSNEVLGCSEGQACVEGSCQ